MSELMKRFVKEEEAPTIVEYAFMLVLVAIAVALAAPSVKDAILTVFNAVSGILAIG